MRTASKIASLFVPLLFAAAVAAQTPVGPISGQIINQYGQPLPFAHLRVCSVTSTGSPCTPTTPTFLDYALTIPAPDDYIVDQYGNYLLYVPALAAPNLYEIEVYPAPGITWTYVLKGPASAGASGTVTNFSAGNLTPLFTTSVANPTTAPALTFNLSNAPTFGFYGNFTGGTAAPLFWTMVQGANMTLTADTGAHTLTLAAAGGSTGCSTSGIVAGALLFPNNSGNCVGSNQILASGPTGGVNGADEILIQNYTGNPGDDINMEIDSAVDPGENFLQLSPHLVKMFCTNSGTTSLGCTLEMKTDDAGQPSANGGLNPIWIRMFYSQPGNHPNYTGVLVEQALTATGVINEDSIGYKVTGPSPVVGTSVAHEYGFQSVLNADTESVGEEVGYLAVGNQSNANYCAMVSRTGVTFGTGTTGLTLDCGPSHTSSFFFPVVGTTFNGVALTTGGSATAYLSGTGAYTVPPGVPTTTRTCNANGCYRVEGDGTITQWGAAPGIGGGGTEPVTFPTAFTTTTNLTVTTGTGGGAGNVLTKADSVTTTGFTAGIAGVVFVGGSGSAPTGSETIQWIAIGH